MAKWCQWYLVRRNGQECTKTENVNVLKTRLLAAIEDRCRNRKRVNVYERNVGVGVIRNSGVIFGISVSGDGGAKISSASSSETASAKTAKSMASHGGGVGSIFIEGESGS